MTPTATFKCSNTIGPFLDGPNDSTGVCAPTQQQARPCQNNCRTHNQNHILQQHLEQHTRHLLLQQDQTQRSHFYQLSGHSESFKEGSKLDSILKKLTDNEQVCLDRLSNDYLAPFVPQVYGVVERDGQMYLEMQNLLSGFKNPSVMDVKMGCRTYREEELNNALQDPKLRPDMYDKMIEIDQHEPTEEERRAKAVTKPRYMVWRETSSSTANLGFRIEAMLLADGSIDKQFKTIKFKEQIIESLKRFCPKKTVRLKYLKRLLDLRQTLTQSRFFANHEVIGSSLLFVHDEQDDSANIWLIDFAKTYPLPSNTFVTHRKKWILGNHEDGYLIGVDNLIKIFQSLTMCFSQKLSITTDNQLDNTKNAEETTKTTTTTTKTTTTSTTKTVVFHQTAIEQMIDQAY